MIVGIHQPNFVPWLGYFYKMLKSDTFVLLDHVQYTKNSFISRNRLKGPNGPFWLTVPVAYQFGQAIANTKIAKQGQWRRKHLTSIQSCYGRAPFFSEVYGMLSEVYQSDTGESLSSLNISLIKAIAAYLDINTRLVLSSTMELHESKGSEMLSEIVRSLGGLTYLSGFGGANYQEEEHFTRAGVELKYYEFRHPVYGQLWGEFLPNLSIVDMLFNVGRSVRTVLDQV